MKQISIFILIASALPLSVLSLSGCEATTEQTTVAQQGNAAGGSESVNGSAAPISAETAPVETAPVETTAPDEKGRAGETESGENAEASETDAIVFGDKFPEVLAVKITPTKGDNYRFDVTLSSAYDSRERYADAWRVLDQQDNELAVRVLTHDHANEQPFTRSKTIAVPLGSNMVFVEGRDQANGWSGQRFQVKLPPTN